MKKKKNDTHTRSATYETASNITAVGATVGQAAIPYAVRGAAAGAAASALGVVGSVAGIATDWFRSNRSKEEIAAAFDMSVEEFEKIAKRSRIFDKIKNNSEGVKERSVPRAAAGALGGMAGTLIPIPIVGTVAGAMAADYAFGQAFDEKLDEVGQIAASIQLAFKDADKKGQPRPTVSEAQVFAIVAANAPDSVNQHMKQELKRFTGSDSFAEALANGREDAVNHLSKKYRGVMRAHTDLMRDDKNSTAISQLTEALNRGEITMLDLLLEDRFAQCCRKLNLDMCCPETAVMQDASLKDVLPPDVPSHKTKGAGHRHRK